MGAIHKPVVIQKADPGRLQRMGGKTHSAQVKRDSTYSLFKEGDMQDYNLDEFKEWKLQRCVMSKLVGSNIKRLRQSKHLTQEAVAAVAGINAKYLSEVERGAKQPTGWVIERLSIALDVRICEILTANGCKKVDSKLHMELARLFEGKKAQEQQKALKILRAVFE